MIKTWQKNLYTVKDVVNRNGMFLSVQEFNQKFIINVFFEGWGGGGGSLLWMYQFNWKLF